ncbi:hypothetical protein DFH08DRAFT_966315 [Mycena albidolilacea]|uniref:Uncharacterized protein n=1 Tax=Mycena albidolilacea TaxID=1033008 RepID=A0AAD6ZQZ8_9AGAR|nr:hypothetical protein DFH08DRAFT_966315 [Mycena albidolilacea]
MSSSPTSSYLSKAGEDLVRKLYKTVQATRYKDPVDQDSFLTGSAKIVLSFRSQVLSFAVVPDLAECVFNIRSSMHNNYSCLATPFSDTFIHLQDFASEIAHKHQLIREQKRSQADRARTANDIAARIEHQAAFEHPAPTADKDPPTSAITADSTNPPVISQAHLLSPLHELEARLRRLSLSAPLPTPPRSPSSPSPSLPDLVPDFSVTHPNLHVKGNGWGRGRTMACSHRCNSSMLTPDARNSSTATPVVRSYTMRLVPRPFGLPPRPPKAKFVDDWLVSVPKSTGSPAHRKRSAGSSNRSNNPNHLLRRPSHNYFLLITFFCADLTF